MSILFRILASGSSGNALFLRAGGTRLLVDAGISPRRIQHALAEIDERVDDLTAVLLTHEHSDHVRGLASLLAGREIPVLATRGTRRALETADKGAAVAPTISTWGDPLRAARSLQLGGLRVRPFPIPHDAAEPVGFRIEAEGLAVGIATDLGCATPVVERSLAGCDLLVIEANHDLDLLARGPYPSFLKRRVASRKGHLSNDQAAALLARLGSPQLRRVVLAHLSGTNNAADLALRAVAPALAGQTQVELSVGRPRAAGEPIELSARSAKADRGEPAPSLRQLGLFD